MARATQIQVKPGPEGYLAESRSLALSMVSILPLIVVYHWGILKSGYGVRNMAQSWLEGPLRLVGLEAAHLLNVALIVTFIALLWRARKTRSVSMLPVFLMVGEASVYAAVLYRGAPAVAGLVDQRAAHVFFAMGMPRERTASVLLALGAGVYEELVFRFLMLGGGTLLFNKVFRWPRPVAVAAMLVVSSMLFAMAHHVGPLAEPVESYSFIFRAVCGALLGAVFLARGLGVTVWTHSLYNALVVLQTT